jgi:hypothetical protein
MRRPRFRGVVARASLVTLVGIAAILVASCAETPPSVAPTVRPTPIVTPNPHLPTPTTADDVYRGLGSAGLQMTANNATSGQGGDDLVKRINATYLGWPLNLTEFRSASALADRTDWTVDERPGRGEAPISIAASNILVTWGPQTGDQPAKPDARQREGLVQLIGAMDRILSPIRARTVVAVEIPDVAATAPSAGTSAKPTATPKP